MNITTIDNGQVYIHELQEPFDRIEFQFIPNGVRWDRNANYVNIPIVGRNNSKKQLTGGEDRLSFELDFNAVFEDDKRHCIQKLRFLQSLAVNDGFVGPARNVKIAWGDMFRFAVWVVKGVSGNLTDFSSINGYNPMQLTVGLELELDPEENTRLADVRGIYINDGQPIRNINTFTQPRNIA